MPSRKPKNRSNPRASGQLSKGPAGEVSFKGTRCHLPTRNVLYPAVLRISATVAARRVILPRPFGKPLTRLATVRRPTACELRPVKSAARVGEQMAQRVKVVVAQARGGQSVDVRRLDLRAVAAKVGEAHVVKQDIDHVRRPRRRARLRREVGNRLGDRRPDHAPEVLVTLAKRRHASKDSQRGCRQASPPRWRTPNPDDGETVHELSPLPSSEA